MMMMYGEEERGKEKADVMAKEEWARIRVSREFLFWHWLDHLCQCLYPPLSAF